MENTTSQLIFSLLGIRKENPLGIRYQFNVKNSELYIECATKDEIYATPTQMFMNLIVNKLNKKYKLKDSRCTAEEGYHYGYHIFTFVDYEYAEMKKIKIDIIAELSMYASFVGIDLYTTTRSTTVRIESHQNFEDFLVYLQS